MKTMEVRLMRTSKAHSMGKEENASIFPLSV